LAKEVRSGFTGGPDPLTGGSLQNSPASCRAIPTAAMAPFL